LRALLGERAITRTLIQKGIKLMENVL
jgi:hypothetical protein